MSPAAATYLPDDLVLEVLARLPARSLYTCMCVSRSWHRLISDPANRPRLAQTLSGLFFSHRDDNGQPPFFFAGLPSPPPPPVNPSFSFLPSSYKEIDLLDSCNGLLLFRCSLTTWAYSRPQEPPRFYVVCNPTTEEWVALPKPTNPPGVTSFSDELMTDTETWSAALGFDPAVSPHFHVFQLVHKDVQYNLLLDAVDIYSSETGNWSLSKSQVSDEFDWMQSVESMTYFNGCLYFLTYTYRVASVDTTGQTWRVTGVVPRREDNHASGPSYDAIGHSRECLLYLSNVIRDHALTIYALQGDKEWVLKRRVSKMDLFGPPINSRPPCFFNVAAFHPDSDLIIFCDRSRKRLVSYELNHGHVHVICALEQVPTSISSPFNPYVPLYSGALVASSKVK